MKFINSVLLVSVLIMQTATSSPRISASFNCSKATQPIEYSICSNKELAILDKKMAEIYKIKKKKSSVNENKSLKLSQKKWLKKRIGECKVSKSNYADIAVINCLKTSYETRIREIQNNNSQYLFYKNSINKSKFTLLDRAKWKAFINWPNSCEFEDLKYMSDAGLRFYKIGANTSILRVACDVYAYQSEYKLYTVIMVDKNINTVSLKIPHIKFKNKKWNIYHSNQITGHIQYDSKDNSLLTIHKYSGAGQCGVSATYSIFLKDEIPVIKLTRAWGNNDCNKNMGEEDWPEIELTEIK